VAEEFGSVAKELDLVLVQYVVYLDRITNSIP
jgi:hypothetical protein